MPFYERGAVRIHYEEAGKGFPLLIIPGGGLNSRLTFTAPTAGEYVIRATSLEDGLGRYELGLAEAPPAPPSKPIAIGDEIKGELGSDSATNDGGQRAETYRFTGTNGQRVASVHSRLK